MKSQASQWVARMIRRMDPGTLDALAETLASAALRASLASDKHAVMDECRLGEMVDAIALRPSPYGPIHESDSSK